MSAQEVRAPAVAGFFYPGEAGTLRATLARMLAENPAPGPAPKAVIAPHAGYEYSGPIAARAYNRVAAAAQIRRVVLLGPAHRVALQGLALPAARVFRTPLGDVPLDEELCGRLRTLQQVKTSAAAHAQEHSLEVHLPFLQTVLGNFTLLPLVVGWADPQETGAVLETLWGGPETLVVISSDLSHYHRYERAQELDAESAACIETLHPLTEDWQACGAHPINGLLQVARKRALRVTRLDLRNSGDTAGDKSRVVGYGAWAFHAA